MKKLFIIGVIGALLLSACSAHHHNYGHMAGRGMTSSPMMNYNEMEMMNNENGMMNYNGMGVGQNPIYQP